MAEAATRLGHAEAFLATAQLASSEGEESDGDYEHVATGNAVLAAIAASDALCCKLLGERARGQDHRDAVGVLEEVRFGPGAPSAQQQRARELGQALAVALDIKDASHYGTRMLGAAQVTRTLRAAEKLVDAARQAVRGGLPSVSVR